MRRSTKKKKDYKGRWTKKKKVHVKHEVHDQPSLRNRRSTPKTQTQPPDSTTIPRAVTRQPMSPSVGTPPPRQYTSTTKASIPLARLLAPTSSASTSPVKAAKTMQRAPTPSATPPTPTQIARLPQVRQSSPTPRAPIRPTRAPTLPLDLPIQQQADMARKLTKEQESMAAKSTESESEFEVWRKVLDQNTRNLKQYLIPDEIIHLDTGFELFNYTDRRDIKEESNTTKKNEAILIRVRSKGVNGYKDFKERLKMTYQSKLADLLTYKEKGLNTEEIEHQLDQMLEERITSTEYDKLKRELQGDLIKFYRKRCSSISLSPLLEEKETPLAGFYVMPDIVAVKQMSLTCHTEIRTPIKSMGELFSTGSEDQQEIYLSADAGFGKTAFSKYLAITWCQAHRYDKKYDVNKCFKANELKALSKFEFLFLVFLRDHTSVSHIDDMIKQQFTLHLPSLKSLDEVLSRAKLQEVLSREKCLIILDGLDEWTFPDKSSNKETEEIPHRCVRDNCVILTTTRPWKLGVSNLKTSQMDKKVELVQLSSDSMWKLEENAIGKIMTGVHDDGELKSKIQELNKVICDRGLQHMQVIPLLLMYIVCLWCNNIPIGNSKHDIYTNIIEFLLSRMSEKNKKVRPSRESSDSEVPDYFKGHKFCKMFYSLITSLAELAYQTLFNENRENTLVFERTVAEKYLTADDMKLSLLSGILSESRSATLIKEIIKVSFSHKTVQEFFAAIFISSQSDARKTIVEKCRNIQDILDMSNICEFISKMNADLMCALSYDLMSVINEDEKIRRYRTRTGNEGKYTHPYDMYNLQKMFTSCLQDMPASENIQLCFQDFLIDWKNEHSKQLQRLLKQNKTNIKSLRIEYPSSSLREIIDSFSLTDLSHIQRLYYCVRERKAEINRMLFPSLQNVFIAGGKGSYNEESLSENIPRCQNLQYLSIGSFSLSHKILETIFNFISGQKSVKELTLWSLYCYQHGKFHCRGLNLDLSQHSTLRMLDLQGLPGMLQLNISTQSLVEVKLAHINLYKSSLLLSRDMMNIESIQLQYIEMSVRSLQNFIAVLKNLRQSIRVQMLRVNKETEYDSFKENIRISKHFHVILDMDGDYEDWFVFITRNLSIE